MLAAAGDPPAGATTYLPGSSSGGAGDAAQIAEDAPGLRVGGSERHLPAARDPATAQSAATSCPSSLIELSGAELCLAAEVLESTRAPPAESRRAGERLLTVPAGGPLSSELPREARARRIPPPVGRAPEGHAPSLPLTADGWYAPRMTTRRQFLTSAAALPAITIPAHAATSSLPAMHHEVCYCRGDYSWHVGSVDYDGDGEVFTTSFSFCRARERAIEYAKSLPGTYEVRLCATCGEDGEIETLTCMASAAGEGTQWICAGCYEAGL